MAGWPVLQSGDEHRNVRTLQYLLRHQGESLEVDGAFGPHTQSALEKFQGAIGLEPDGVVTEPVWLLLIAGLSLGDAGEAVKAAQVQLLYRRTLPDVDGVFGMKTDISVRRFQVLKRLPADGRVTVDTWREMLAEEFLPGDSAAAGGRQVDPADWRAQLLSKLRPGIDSGTAGHQEP